MKFTEFGFTPALLDSLDAMGFEEATPVQELSIPAIMRGDDVLACAQTGTGKTAAFLLPIINHFSEDPQQEIDTIILEPTRELAMQVDRQLEGFSYFTPVSSIPIYGGRDGQSMEEEKRALKRGAPIVVATPGRFIAHLQLGYVNLDKVRHLILDEADRMLDMGFIHDIMNIINRLPRERQTLLFSATMPDRIRKFSKEIMRPAKPTEVRIAVSKPAENIIQGIYEIEDSGKIQLARQLLTGKKNLNRVIIFAGTKKVVRELSRALQQGGLKAAAISSDLEQEDREKRLAEFRAGSLPIVVATDVLARGIDISGIDVVINYDVPNDAEDYVHRIGRTARAEASGIALTFVNRKDRGRFRRIEELIDMKVRRLPLPENLAEHAKPQSRSSYDDRRKGGNRKGRGKSAYGRNSSRGKKR